MARREIRFGVIGLGLMGREFGSVAARWCHLLDDGPRPVIAGICSRSEESRRWFLDNFPSIEIATSDYHELLESDSIDAIYCAVPHHLHRQFYVDIIEAGKHLLGEKPFGIDLEANTAILAAANAHPEVLVRCASEFPFAPAVQRVGRMIEGGELGRIIEVEAGFLHSSDLNTEKPINWKRMIAFNGEYGCMGDLGMHVCHVPFRAGWRPKNVRAVLSNIVRERPDGKGGRAACETWDNATLLCEAEDPNTSESFPMTLKTQRIAPGEKNTWYLSVLGTKRSVRFTTKNINSLALLDASLGDQAWQTIDMGQETSFKSITGGIFEFGFSDAMLQMWAAFLYELENEKPKARFAGCATPDETALSHRLFTAALRSQVEGSTAEVS